MTLQKGVVGGIVLWILAVAPALAMAQTTTDVQSQIAALQAKIQQLETLLSSYTSASTAAQQSGACVNLTYNMGPQSTDATVGGDVTLLQNYLIGKGYLTGSASGTYDSATMQAVEQLQSAIGIVTTSSSAGYTGPRTRGAIACPGKGNLTVTPAAGYAPFTTTFSGTGQSTSYTLDFGDGSTGVLGSHTYTVPGTYTGKLINSNGTVVGSATVVAYASAAGGQPIANIDPQSLKTYTNGAATTAATLSGSASNVTQLTVTVTGQPNVSATVTGHQWSATIPSLVLGSYPVQVLDNDSGASNGAILTSGTLTVASTTRTVCITAQYYYTPNSTDHNPCAIYLPTATPPLSATPTSGAEPLSVSFAGRGLTNGSQYTIEYGDGSTSGTLTANAFGSITALHVYDQIGTSSATLEDSSGDDLGDVTITVTSTNPSSSTCTLSVSPSTISPGETFTLSWASPNATVGTLTSTGFSQGASSPLIPASSGSTDLIKFTALGSYTFTGIFTGASGSTTCQAPITVVSPGTIPTATLTAADATMNGQPGTNITVNVGDTLTYAWSASNILSASSNYTSDSPDTCPVTTSASPTSAPFTLVVSTNRSGTSQVGPIPACRGGHTYVVNYNVVGTNGQTASASTIIHVNPSPSVSSSYVSCGTINTAAATYDSGYSYIVPFVSGADTISAPTQSDVMVFENGTPMGPAHSIHQDIRNLGQGRFSHWNNGVGNYLYLSALDNSNPMTDGYTFTWGVPQGQTCPLLAVASASQYGSALTALQAILTQIAALVGNSH